MTHIPDSAKRGIEAEIERRGLRTPPTGGSGITKTCAHDFVFLRDNYSHLQAAAAKGLMPRIPAEMKDTFYCRHCLEYREVKR